MKKQTLFTAAIMMLMASQTFGQVLGNVNYQHRIHLPQDVVKVAHPRSDEFVISVKGISNVAADYFVAIFSVKQAGKSVGEVNELINKRLQPLVHYCQQEEGLSSYIDMISFMPVYEVEVVNKIFSKTTYNEVPKGFEVKKNIHIRYSEPQRLNDIIQVAAGSEIYDLVRVDYFSNDLESKKQELLEKAHEMLNKKIDYQEKIRAIEIADYKRRASDGFTVVYPIEMYTRYEPASTTKLSVDKNNQVNAAEKQTTYYYKPYFDKDFDFSINPVVFEPRIQIMYEVKVLFIPKPEEKPEKTKEEVVEKKELLIITSSGEMKTIQVK